MLATLFVDTSESSGLARIEGRVSSKRCTKGFGIEAGRRVTEQANAAPNFAARRGITMHSLYVSFKRHAPKPKADEPSEAQRELRRVKAGQRGVIRQPSLESHAS